MTVEQEPTLFDEYDPDQGNQTLTTETAQLTLFNEPNAFTDYSRIGLRGVAKSRENQLAAREAARARRVAANPILRGPLADQVRRAG